MGVVLSTLWRKIKQLFCPNEEWNTSWPMRWLDGLIESNNPLVRFLYRSVWSNVMMTIQNVSRIITWLPILWHDRDWDYAFILKILKYKLSRVRQCISSNGIIEGADRVAKQISYAEFLIDRILEDDYCETEMKQHIQKWGPYCRRKKWTNGQLVGHAFHIRQNSTTHQKWQQQIAEERAIHQKQMDTRNKDRERLFRHLSKYIERWWD